MAKFNSSRDFEKELDSDSGKEAGCKERSRRRKQEKAAKAAAAQRRKNVSSNKKVEADKAGKIVSDKIIEPSYTKIAFVEAVSVKVAKPSGWMTFYDEKQSASGIEHWMNGKPLKGAFLNLCFYNIQEADMGKKITANVQVIEKSLSDGRSFIMLDVFKMENTKASSRLRILDASIEEEGYNVIGTDKKIVFAPIK